MDSQVNADGWRLKFWMCDLWPTIETVLQVSNRDFVCMFSYTRLISAEYLHTYYTLWSDEVWQHAPNPNELFLKGKVSVHQTFVMLFSLSPFGRDHLAFGEGCRDGHGPGPLTFIYHKLSVNIHHNYVNMNECTFEAQFYMYEYSFIMIKWNWQTLSEFPGCVCMKKQRFWLSLFTVCLKLKELWNIRTFTCLTFNRKNLGSFKAASCFSSLKPAHSCTWQFAGCTHVSSNTHSGEDCVSLSKTWISSFLQTQVTTKKQQCQVVPTGIVSGNSTIQL